MLIPWNGVLDVVTRLEAIERQISTGSVRRHALMELNPEVEDILFEIASILHYPDNRFGAYASLIEVLKKMEPDIKDLLDADQFEYVSRNENLACLKRLAEAASQDACVICGEELGEERHNPSPIADDGDCCSACNSSYVIPARIGDLSTETIEQLRDFGFDLS